LRLLRALNDESGQILRQVVIVGLIVLVVGFLIVEVGPIIVDRISIINDAEDVANTVAFEYRTTGSEQGALQRAALTMRLMGYSDEEIKESSVLFLPAESEVKQTIRVTIIRYASTLVTRHIKYLKRFTRIAKTVEASVAESTSGKNE
jgi:hypothetical protein